MLSRNDAPRGTPKRTPVAALTRPD
jgi:hypothetical protein